MSERQKRLERIQRLQRIQAMQDQVAGQQTPDEEEVQSAEAPQQEQPSNEPTMADAMYKGGMQGLSFHMSDEASAAYDTTQHVLDSVAKHYSEIGAKGITDALPNIQEVYNKNLDKERLLIDQARKKYPMAFSASEIAGSIMSTAATWGAGGAFHAGRALSASKIGSIIGNSSIAAAHGFGASEDETIAGMIEDTFKAGAIGTLGDVAGDKVGRVAQGALDKVSTSSLLKYLRVKAGTTKNSLQSFGKNIDDWAQRILGYKASDGKKLVNVFQKRSEMAERVATERAVQGNQMGAILNDIDTNTKVTIHHDQMYDDILENIFEGPNALNLSLDRDEYKLANKLKEDVYHMFYHKPRLDPKTKQILNPREPKEISLTQIHRYISRTYKKARKGLRSEDPNTEQYWQARMEIADIMHDHVDDIINTTGEIRQTPLFAQYAKHREAWGDLKETEKLLAASLKADPAEGFLNEVFTNAADKYVITAGVMGTKGGLPGADYAAAVAGLRAISSNRAFNAILGKSANIIASAIDRDPNKFGKLGSGMLVASSISSKALKDYIPYASAYVDLATTPVARSTREVIRRADSLLTIIDKANKPMAHKLRIAIEQGNDAEIAGIMSNLAQEDTAGIIEKGMGWEGKAVTDSDKQAVEGWLKQIPNSKKRMILTKKFQDEQMIPEEMTNPQLDTDPVNKFIKPAAKRGFRNPKDLGY